MKRFRYCDFVVLFYVLELLLHLSCPKVTHSRKDHVKLLSKDLKSEKGGTKSTLEADLKHRRTLQRNKDESKSETNPISSTFYPVKDKQSPSKEPKSGIGHNLNSHRIVKADTNYGHTAHGHNLTESVRLKNKTKELSNEFPRTKTEGSHKKEHTKRKKKLFKKYALMQSFSPSQQQSQDYQPIITGAGASNEGYAPAEEGGIQTAGEGEQEQQPQQQQQIGEGNPLQQYAASQENGYQQDNSQPSVASFANGNSEEAGQSDGAQPERLEQAMQLQQEAYTQQPQEQGQEQENTSPDGQVGGMEGQEGQMVEGGQLQFQGDQGHQGQEQGTEEGQVQEQGTDQTGYSRDSQSQSQELDQQQQPQELGQQASMFSDQQLQQQDQPQEYQQQQQTQQQGEGSQEQEGTAIETQGLPTSSNSYGGVFGTEGPQAMPEQQEQGMMNYANEQSNEQSNEGGEKSLAPGSQYASSIEEALKEPSTGSPEANTEGSETQGGPTGGDNANVINMGGGGSDSSEGIHSEFMGTGTINAPSGYSTAAVDDNGNQLETSPEANGYAPMNGPASNNEESSLNGFEGMQQSTGPPSSDAQTMLNYAGPQFHQHGLKVPPMDEEFYKIIDIANKHGPTAVKGCKGCPPHASCIDKVCIINDDQPLAHILSALSGPEPDDESTKVDCQDCHYNAKCDKTGCVCKAGFTGDGQDCRPDTCLPGCKQHGKCIKGFCVCDHHHYFNGYECAPYKITHRNCPVECATSCGPTCPANCCKHHPVLKIHYNDGNPHPPHPPSNTPAVKNVTVPPPAMVVLKPDEKQEEHVANYAPEFDKRPDDSQFSNLETVDLTNPAGGFSVSEMEAKPLLEEDCPGNCKTECRESCPVRCCLRKCPINCMENCRPPCPKRCCYLPGVKNLFPMMDPKVQENFMKVMVQKFCPGSCKNKCNSNCPPICCKHSSTSIVPNNGNVPKLNGEGKNSDDFFRNAMSWFGMMNFLNMMYNMYGNLYANKHPPHSAGDSNQHKVKLGHPPKPQDAIGENHLKFEQVGIAEGPRKSDLHCPKYCNKTCLHICPKKCCNEKPKDNAIGVKTQCQPSCKWFCSTICPARCCSKPNDPSSAQHHPTVPLTTTKISTTTAHTSPPAPAPAPAPSQPKPPNVCTPGCPVYCYPHCLENCCQRGDVSSPKQQTQPDTHLKLPQPDQTQQPYNDFFANAPTPTGRVCPSICETHCGPTCPFQCCGQVPALPLHNPFTSASQDAHLCPGNCVSECFPACTISCCNAGSTIHDMPSNPLQSPTQKRKVPALPPSPPPPLSLPPPAATCHPGCSRSCYPNCDETCCRASSDQGKPTQGKLLPHFTIKIPCPSECRPYNCLYYCHHDCCLQSKSAAENPSMEMKKSLRGMSKSKLPNAKIGEFHTNNTTEHVIKDNARRMNSRGNGRTLKLKKRNVVPY